MLTSLRAAAVAVAALAYAACTLDEDLVTDPGGALAFSVDTLRFDTVFTEVGSATRSFKIYNPLDRPLEINRVAVRDELGGSFRINVDGESGREVRGVFLPPEDSIYVFVEVTVDPNAPPAASPFVFAGAVVIEATDTEQLVHLEAFGQNAVYLPTDRTRGLAIFLECDGGEVVLDDPRPYVLYGSLVVEDCALTFPPGARLYVHGGIVRPSPTAPLDSAFTDGRLIAGPGGRLNLLGSAEAPVLVASDRLEEGFATASGQYFGLVLGRGSGPHRISHARLRNAIYGVFADSVAVRIDHTEISYASAGGILGYAADVTASNVAVYGVGGRALLALKGGRYEIDYATFANLGARAPAVDLRNWAELADSTFVAEALDARLRNVIAYGTERQAISLSDISEADDLALDADFDVALATSVVRSNPDTVARPILERVCTECLFVTPDSVVFLAPARDTFLLDSLSVARDIAAPVEGVDDDLLGRPRDPDRPDAGAYEYVAPE